MRSVCGCMWASSAAMEIMKTPWSESIETSMRSRRTLTAHHPRSGALYVGIERKRRTGSSSAARFRQQLGSRVGAVERLGQRLGGLLLRLGQLLGHLDLEPVADISLAATAGLRRPLSLQSLDRSVFGARTDLDLLRPFERRHLDRRAAQRLGDVDRHGHLEVAAVEPLEDGRGGDARDDEEVPRRSAALAGLALAGEPYASAVLDPGRDVHLVALGLLGDAGAGAGG